MWYKKSEASKLAGTLTTTPASTAYLIGPGNLRVRGGLLWWQPTSGTGIQLHPKRLERITIFGLADISGVAFHLLWRQSIHVSFLAPNGNKLLAQVQPAGSRPGLKRLQHLAAADQQFSLKIALATIDNKIDSTCSTLRYYQRQSLLKDSGPVLKQLTAYRKKATRASSIPQLLGIEGNAARLWRAQFARLLPEGWQFYKRSYRPSRDPVNALLSLGYSLATNRCKMMLAAADLDPYVGFLHQVRPGRPSLACDSIEPLRVAMVDQINYLDDPSIFRPIEFDQKGEPLDLPDPVDFLPGIDRLYVSNGDGTMTAQTLGDAVKDWSSSGLGILVTDFDHSPGNEMFVANDQRPNHFWRLQTESDGTQKWNESAVASGVASGKYGESMACMGVAAVDFDHNGTLDLHVTNFLDQWSNLFMQNLNGTFRDASVPFDLAEHTQPMVGFGTQALDHDNNGQWDIAIGNGHIDHFEGLEFAMPTQFFVGTESGFQLAEVEGDDDYWTSPHYSRAMAKTDWNRDGKVDLVITDFKEETVLLQNFTATPNHWLRVELVGATSERDAIGARVTIRYDETQRVQMVQTGGYLSNNERASFFGLGQTEQIDEMVVGWPSGSSQSFKNVKADQSYLVVEGEAGLWKFDRPAR